MPEDQAAEGLITAKGSEEQKSDGSSLSSPLELPSQSSHFTSSYEDDDEDGDEDDFEARMQVTVSPRNSIVQQQEQHKLESMLQQNFQEEAKLVGVDLDTAEVSGGAATGAEMEATALAETKPPQDKNEDANCQSNPHKYDYESDFAESDEEEGVVESKLQVETKKSASKSKVDFGTVKRKQPPSPAKPAKGKRKSMTPKQATSPGHFEIDFDSPRFREARLRTGIRKAELRAKVFDDFSEHGLESIVQQVRFEHYQRKRDERMRLVLEMRDKIIQEEELHQQSQWGSNSHTQDRKEQVSKLLAMERQQLERIKERQRVELEQMMQNEVRLAKEVAAQELRAKQDEERKLENERRIQQKAKDAEMHRVRQEQAKHKQLLKEEEERRRLAEKENLAAKRRAKLERKRELEAKALLRKEEEEAERKKKLRKEETARLFRLQQEKLLRKQKLLRKKEEERMAALERKRDLVASELAEKQARQKERVQKARRNQEKLLDLQRTAFEEKRKRAEAKQRELEHQRQLQAEEAAKVAEERQKEIERIRSMMEKRAAEKRQRTEEQAAYVEHRLRQRQVHMELEMERKRCDQEERDRKRQQAYSQMTKFQEKKRQAIFRKQKQKLKAAERRAKEERVHDLAHAEIVRLREQDRLDAIERKRRKDDYNRKRLEKKIAEESRRADAVRQQREELIRQRRQAREQAAIEKEAVVGAFTKMRETGRLTLPKELRKLCKVLPDVEAGPAKLSKFEMTKVHLRPASAQSNSPSHAVRGPNQGLKQSASQSVVSKSKGQRPQSAFAGSKPKASRRSQSPFPQSVMGAPAKRKTNKRTSASRLKAIKALEGEIEAIRKEQKIKLLATLNREKEKEDKRQQELDAQRDASQRQRLEKKFAIQRLRATEAINCLKQRAETMLEAKTNKLDWLRATM
mmetsp:Transcript_14506/g.26011  ORF Transcript_14506/g.26011 Transcript_14506/m.26011 type:complete len:918 (-) Transcript_14506:46-2799(-)